MVMTSKVTKAHTAKEFGLWSARARPGDVCEYHRGLSLYVEDKEGNLVTPARRVETAALAWRLGPAILKAEADKANIEHGPSVVNLVQRKTGHKRTIGPNQHSEYSYLAIKARG